MISIDILQSKRTTRQVILIFIFFWGLLTQSFGQINEFKKILPVEDATGFMYGSKMSFSNGYGIITAPGPCLSGVPISGNTSISCGRVYIVKRDIGERWKLLQVFSKQPWASDDSELKYGTAVAADGPDFAVGFIEGAQAMFSPVMDIYQSNGSGQVTFIKQLNYTFGGDYSPQSNPTGRFPIAMASGLLIAGNSTDPNRDPMTGTPISNGRVLIHSKNLGGSNNWGLLKVLEAPLGVNSSYATSLAMTSGIIVVGASDINTIYIYAKDFGGVDNWGLIKTITPADAATGDSFGYSISIANSTIAVGSPFDDDNGNDSGSIYIYSKDQGGVDNWGLTKKILPSDGTADDQFGYSVSVANNEVAVGVPQDDDNGNNSGSIYHFGKDQGGVDNWGLVNKIAKAAGTFTNDRLGESLAIDGSQLITGIPFDDLQGSNSGAVSLYIKNGNAFEFGYQWSAAKAIGGGFGSSVSLTTDKASVNDFIFARDNFGPNEWGVIANGNFGGQGGNPVDFHLEGDRGYRSTYHPPVNDCCDAGTGSLTVVSKDQGGVNGWGQVKTILFSDLSDHSLGTNEIVFGKKAATFQDFLAVHATTTAFHFVSYVQSSKGQVYLFSRNSGGTNNWGEIKKITAPIPQEGDYFGSDLSIQNEVLAISATGYLSNKGAVFVHSRNTGGSDNWGLVKRIDTPDGTANDKFGTAIELNGTDLFVAAPGNDANNGAVYLFKKDQGGTDSWGFVKKITSPITNPGSEFGTDISFSGQALVVKDKDRNVYLYQVDNGGTNNWGYAGQLLSSDYTSTDQFGASFSIANNVIIVGAPAQSNALGTNIGAAYLFYTPPPSPILNNATGITNSSFSISWGAISDVTGYKVDVSTASDFSSFVTGYNALVTTQTSIAISAMAPGQTYFVRVRSVSALGGDSNFSNVVNVLTAPSAPVAIDATLVTSATFTANWNAVSGATGYSLDVSQDNFTNFLLGYNGLTVNGTSFNVTGLTASTAYQFRVRATNSSGSSDNSNSIEVMTVEPPSAPLALGNISFNPRQNSSSSQTLGISVSGGTPPYTTVARQKGILSTDFTENTLTEISPGNYSFVIAPSMLDEIGVQFEIEATDAVNNADIKSGTVSIGFDDTNSPALPFERFGGTDESWNIFSVPYELDNKSISTILADYDQARHEFDWRIMRYRTTTNDYVNFNIGQVKLGEAYWFNAKENIASNVGAGKTTSQVPFSLVLTQGWNMVGNPYPISISWNKVLADNEGVAGVSALQVFSGITQSAGDALAPFKGGFVFADAAAAVIINPITAKSGGRVSSTKGHIASRDVDEEEWMLPLSLSINGIQEELGGIGMHPEAKELKDVYDAMAVPRFIKFTDLSTEHQDYFYPWFSRDVVPTQASHSWNFTLSSNKSKGLTQLIWDQQALQGKLANLYLLDKTSGSVIDMKLRGSYPVDLNRGDFKFEVYYSSKGEPYLPQDLILGDAYPNPASTSATIPVVLPADAGAIALTVYDMTGKPVATLAKGNFAPGAYEFKWDIKERKSIDGIFIYRLLFTENAHAPIQKKLIIK